MMVSKYYVPFEIQEDIIKRVHDVRSLVRFRSVSKQWKSLIDSSEFITHHTLVNHRSGPHHLLLRYYAADSHECKYVSIVDDDSFPRHKLSLDVSPVDKLVPRASVLLGCCHGLVCLYGDIDPMNRRKMIVVWNPSIRKSIGILPPDGISTFGFGVCPKTGDPKIVGIPPGITSSPTPMEAMVFRLSSRSWTSVPMNLHHSEFSFSYYQVVVDGAIYWVVNYYYGGYYVVRIILFDLTSEEFEHVELPTRSKRMCISKLNESLVVLDRSARDIDVWMMLKNHGSTSFTKLFTVKVPLLHIILGFRNNGQLILHRSNGFRKNGQLAMEREGFSVTELEVYEPYSKRMSGLGIHGYAGSTMTSYIGESLLLFNYDSNSIIE